MFCFHSQFLLAGFADPVMFAIDKGMVVDTLAVVFRTEIAFHMNAILAQLRLEFLGQVADDYQVHPPICGTPFRRVIR